MQNGRRWQKADWQRLPGEGDKDGARELRNEVVKEGDAAQQGRRSR